MVSIRYQVIYKGDLIVIKKLTFDPDEDTQEPQLNIEMEILKSLANQNNYIINFYGFIIEENKVTKIILEYLKYGNLEYYLKQKKYSKIDSKWIVWSNDITSQICKGLKFLHENGIFHNDIKTDNIMFTDENYRYIKIIDFGYSGSKQINPFTGTYNAPEMDPDIYMELYEKYEDFWPPFFDKNDILKIFILQKQIMRKILRGWKKLIQKLKVTT